MPRFHVSVTMLATVTIDAVDAAAATREAVRFTELSGPEGGFIDGWNSAAEPGSPVIVDFSNVDIEEPDAEDVREVDDTDLEEAADGETCTACHRPSIDCSRAPCPAVIADRGDD